MSRALTLALLLLSACASSGSGIHPLRPLELATAPYQPAVTASLTGSLAYENGCLLFIEDETRQSFLPVWPTGSLFNGTSVIFHEPGKTDQPVVIAQEFVLSGTATEWPQLPGEYYARFEAQCRAPPLLVSGIRPAD